MVGGSQHNKNGTWKMKTAHLLAAAALAFMPASAHAYLLCANPVQTIGATGSNPVRPDLRWPQRRP